MALSSSAMGWTRVSVWHSTSTGRLPLPTKLRMISMQWQPRSMMAPPPVSRPSQNHAEWGPGWVSRDRTQVMSPSAPARDRGDGLERLGRVAQVLEVAAEDARALDGGQHPRRLVGGPPEGLGAQHRLARRGDGRHGLLMEVVGQRHHDHVRVGMPDGGLEVRRVLRDVPALPERPASRLGPGVHDPDPVGAALAVERLGVEVADEPGAEHGDGVGRTRDGPPQPLAGDASRSRRATRTVRRRWSRAPGLTRRRGHASATQPSS